MKMSLMNLIATSIIATGALASSAFAQDVTDPGHPRVNQVDQRLDNQQNRVDNGLAKGQMAPGQAGRDQNRDARVQKQMTRDEAKHNGHLTRREQRHMNHELDHNSRKIHNQRHSSHPVRQ